MLTYTLLMPFTCQTLPLRHYYFDIDDAIIIIILLLIMPLSLCR